MFHGMFVVSWESRFNFVSQRDIHWGKTGDLLSFFYFPSLRKKMVRVKWAGEEWTCHWVSTPVPSTAKLSFQHAATSSTLYQDILGPLTSWVGGNSLSICTHSSYSHRKASSESFMLHIRNLFPSTLLPHSPLRLLQLASPAQQASSGVIHGPIYGSVSFISLALNWLF